MNAPILAFIVAVFLFLPPSLSAQSDVELRTDDTFDEPNTSRPINMANRWTEKGEVAVPLLGMSVREEMGRIASGAPMAGLGVMAVSEGSPANRAGIRAPDTLLRTTTAVTAVTLLFVGGMFFPPMMMGAIALSDTGIGDAHDLIVAVDGYRTHNLAQFQAAIRRAQPGQTVYLRVIRGDEGVDFRVEIPTDSPQPPQSR